ncbi:MAG: NusA-like transcription termination signal-binding factor [Candidatus Woesearchaeota archaeon]|nr:NusA-like transcription termination signal-binding factor [Candidatus Woesearchaeota archaeon]
MNTITLDTNAIQSIQLFERFTRARCRDYIPQETISLFIVEPDNIGKAIGKQAVHVKQLEQALRKKIRIIEYSAELRQFLENVIAPLRIARFEEHDGIILLTAKDLKTRGMLIGRNASHLRAYETIIKRHFPIQEIKVQ